MIVNNNLKICHTLAWRDFKFRKAKNMLLAFAAILITGLYAFTFLLGSSAPPQGYHRGAVFFCPEKSRRFPAGRS